MTQPKPSEVLNKARMTLAGLSLLFRGNGQFKVADEIEAVVREIDDVATPLSKSDDEVRAEVWEEAALYAAPHIEGEPENWDGQNATQCGLRDIFKARAYACRNNIEWRKK